MTSDSPVSPALKKLNRKIAELHKKKNYLPESMVNVVTQVALLQLEAEAKVRFAPQQDQTLPQAILDKITPADAHFQGAFLLAREDFPVDMAVAEELVPAILQVIQQHAPELASLAGKLAESLASGEYSLQDACHAALVQTLVSVSTPAESSRDAAYSESASGTGAPTGQNESYFTQWEQKHPEAPGFFRFVAQSAIMPSVTVAARLIGQKHRESTTWLHGHCPVCGSHPLMSRLKDDEGFRMNTCSFCSFEFRVPRLGCPFCLANAPDGGEYYASEDEPGYQIDVCNSCKNYIKIADFRKLDKVYLPMLDDLESLTLDLYARQMGYTRPTLSAWGF